MPDSIIFKVAKFSFKKSEKDLFKTANESLKEKAPFDAPMKDIWKEFKTLLKIENYLHTQKVVVAEGLDKQVLSLGKACKFQQRDLPLINRLIKIEVFLKSRFSSKSVWITDDEVKRLQSANPKLTLNEIKNKELERKITESIDMFIKTLERQITHEDFW